MANDPLGEAMDWVARGVPYVWGGAAQTGADCSGFIQYIFGKHGVPLARTTSGQFQQGSQVPVGPPGNELLYAQPGDVVFFGMGNASLENQHEGIILSTAGKGQMINEPHGGAVASIAPVIGWDSSEPFSGIRRFSTGAGGLNVIANNPVDPAAADTETPDNPTIFNLWFVKIHASQGRALVGAVSLVGGSFVIYAGSVFALKRGLL